jgi:hypothetical protein
MKKMGKSDTGSVTSSPKGKSRPKKPKGKSRPRTDMWGNPITGGRQGLPPWGKF